MSHVKDPNCFLIVADFNKYLSPELVPLPVSSFLWQVFHCSGIINILGSSSQFQLLCMAPSVLHHHLQLRLYLHQWSSLHSHHAKAQLLSKSLHAFKTHIKQVILTHYHVQLQHKVQP